MNCPKCQAVVAAKAKFCDQCGLSLVENVEFLHQKAVGLYQSTAMSIAFPADIESIRHLSNQFCHLCAFFEGGGLRMIVFHRIHKDMDREIGTGPFFGLLNTAT